jgi:hypothetical protein
MILRDYKIVRNQKGGLEPIRVPSILEVAWAAGIYEGEGSCITSDKKKNAFSVMIAQKDPELLYRLRDMFGGSVKPYMNGGFSINHWRVSGNYGRVFLALIFPYLTARRKAQIEATGAKWFLDEVSQLMYTDRASQPCDINASLWKWLEERAVDSRKKAKVHKKTRQDQFYLDHKNDSAWMEKRRLAVAKWRAKKKSKEQLLNVVEFKKIA